MNKRTTILFLFCAAALGLSAQSRDSRVGTAVETAIKQIEWPTASGMPKLMSYETNADMESLTVRLDDSVSKEKIGSRTVNKLYKLLR